MQLEKFSIGIGDRFYHQGKAQLQAVQAFSKKYPTIAPVWNKSYREHQIVNTETKSVREEADQSVEKLNWKNSYYVDADHIDLETVGDFLKYSDYFTLDVVDYIGGDLSNQEIEGFINLFQKYLEDLELPDNIDKNAFSESKLKTIVEKYLPAAEQARKIYNYIEERKGRNNFITEVSMDETDKPQTPEELFVILFMLAKKGVPVQLIAPKFSGEFYKGIDYVGNVAEFQQEIRDDLQIIDFMTDKFDLPSNLKLSMHSGSDKYSIYPKIKEVLQETNSGFHLKTAGTTWLEEINGLILSGDEGLQFAKNLYKEAKNRFDELSQPYEEVINIDQEKLPPIEKINAITATEFSKLLVNNPNEKKYNPNLRQLLHISYKLAAEAGDKFYNLLEDNSEIIHEQVKNNIYRHLESLFPKNYKG